MTYKLFIDESGDVGIQEQQIANGACPLFFLGGYLVHEDAQQEVLNLIADCRAELNNIPLIHCCRLKHAQKIFFCRKISQLPLKIFGLISEKSEVTRRNFRERIESSGDKFYNKNVHYFLETICKFSIENELQISKIVFEKQDGKDYEKLKNYIRVIQTNPMNPRAAYLQHIVGGAIEASTKTEEPLLQISDAIAHSFFKLCIPDRYDVCEPSYVNEFKNLIPSNGDYRTLNVGTKIVPNINSLRVNDSVKEYIRLLDSLPPDRY